MLFGTNRQEKPACAGFSQSTNTQRKIWMYMRLYPDETNYSVIAKGANVTRHTVAKHYGMIRGMVENQEQTVSA